MRERMHDLLRNAVLPASKPLQSASPTNYSPHHHQRTSTTEMYFKIWTCNLDLLRNLNLEFPSLSTRTSLQCLLLFFLLASPLAVWRRLPREWKGLTRFLIDDGFFVAALVSSLLVPEYTFAGCELTRCPCRQQRSSTSASRSCLSPILMALPRPPSTSRAILAPLPSRKQWNTFSSLRSSTSSPPPSFGSPL